MSHANLFLTPLHFYHGILFDIEGVDVQFVIRHSYDVCFYVWFV